MKTVIGFLMQAVNFLTLAQFVSKNIDTNTTGPDDEAFPDFIERILVEIKAFIGTHPLPPETIARGYAATLAFCNTTIQSMDVIIATNLPKNEKIQKLVELRSDLDNPEKVYQAKNGKDADVLRLTKEKAEERIRNNS